MKRAVVTLLIISAFASVGHGSWTFAKARLAQVLLLAAWRRSSAGEERARPWPWADTHPVARIRIERTGDEFIVLAGASGRTLAFAPGHVDGTARPGERGNCVISAHRDTHFAVLRELQRGDALQVETPGGRRTGYRIEAIFVADAGDTWLLAPRSEPALTLITCHPFDAVRAGGRQRYVVIARASRAA